MSPLMLNRVVLAGEVEEEPTVHFLDSERKVLRVRVRTDEALRSGAGVASQWHDVVAWGSLADEGLRSLHRGTGVYVEGTLRHRTWRDRDEVTHHDVEVSASALVALGSPRRAEAPTPPLDPAGAKVTDGADGDSKRPPTLGLGEPDGRTAGTPFDTSIPF